MIYECVAMYPNAHAHEIRAKYTPSRHEPISFTLFYHHYLYISVTVIIIMCIITSNVMRSNFHNHSLICFFIRLANLISVLDYSSTYITWHGTWIVVQAIVTSRWFTQLLIYDRRGLLWGSTSYTVCVSPRCFVWKQLQSAIGFFLAQQYKQS